MDSAIVLIGLAVGVLAGTTGAEASR